MHSIHIADTLPDSDPHTAWKSLKNYRDFNCPILLPKKVKKGTWFSRCLSDCHLCYHLGYQNYSLKEKFLEACSSYQAHLLHYKWEYHIFPKQFLVEKVDSFLLIPCLSKNKWNEKFILIAVSNLILINKDLVMKLKCCQFRWVTFVPIQINVPNRRFYPNKRSGFLTLTLTLAPRKAYLERSFG